MSNILNSAELKKLSKTIQKISLAFQKYQENVMKKYDAIPESKKLAHSSNGLNLDDKDDVIYCDIIEAKNVTLNDLNKKVKTVTSKASVALRKATEMFSKKSEELLKIIRSNHAHIRSLKLSKTPQKPKEKKVKKKKSKKTTEKDKVEKKLDRCMKQLSLILKKLDAHLIKKYQKIPQAKIDAYHAGCLGSKDDADITYSKIIIFKETYMNNLWKRVDFLLKLNQSSVRRLNWHEFKLKKCQAVLDEIKNAYDEAKKIKMPKVKPQKAEAPSNPKKNNKYLELLVG